MKQSKEETGGGAKPRSYDPLVTLAKRIKVLWRKVEHLWFIKQQFHELSERVNRLEQQLSKLEKETNHEHASN
jgi:polyhydroxyalkanoate synthesis regulator phasin